MKSFGKFCAILIVIIISIIISGIVVSKMWNWFIVPLGVSPIGFWLAAGISMMVSLFTIPRSDIQKRDIGVILKDSLSQDAAKFVLLGIGAIIKSFI